MRSRQTNVQRMWSWPMPARATAPCFGGAFDAIRHRPITDLPGSIFCRCSCRIASSVPGADSSRRSLPVLSPQRSPLRLWALRILRLYTIRSMSFMSRGTLAIISPALAIIPASYHLDPETDRHSGSTMPCSAPRVRETTFPYIPDSHGTSHGTRSEQVCGQMARARRAGACF
jgi:hypothetical protein